MFNVGPMEWGVLLLVGLLLFGPDRLPKVVADAARMLRQLRRMANDVRDDLREELGPELADLDLSAMNPRALVQKHLLDPSLDEVGEVRGAVGEVRGAVGEVRGTVADSMAGLRRLFHDEPTPGVSLDKPSAAATQPAVSLQPATATAPYDVDAT